MKVINCNNIQHLNGYTNGQNTLNFAEDKNGNLVVGVEVLKDNAFAEIRDELSAQPLIDFEPKEIEL